MAVAQLDGRRGQHLHGSIGVERDALDAEVLRGRRGRGEARVVGHRSVGPIEDGCRGVDVRIAVPGVDRKQPERAHRQRQLGDRHLVLGLGGGPRQRDRRERRVDRERQQVGIAATLAERQVTGQPATEGNGNGASAVQIGQRVGRPQRHAPLGRRADDVGTVAQRVVPDGAVGVGFVARSVPADAQHSGLVAPFERGLDVGGPAVHGHRQLDGVVESEGAAEGDGARTGNASHFDHDVGRAVGIEHDVGLTDLAHGPQLEAHRLVFEVAQGLGAALDGLLRRVLDAEHRGGRLRVERTGVAADEQRNLIPEERCRQAAGALDVELVALIAIAHVPGLRLDHPVLGATTGQHVRAVDAAAQVAIALEARFVAVDVTDAAAEVHGAVDLAAQFAPADRHRIGWRRQRGRFLCGRGAGRERYQDSRQHSPGLHGGPPHCRRKVEPAGWFEPWMAEWQVTHDRP